MRSYIVGIGLLVIVAGCGDSRVKSPKPVPRTTTYPLIGVVVKVDAKNDSVTLRHEAIPDYMDAMPMPFHVSPKDRSTLDDLVVGDQVSATLKVNDDRLEIEDINVTEPAPPKELRLDTSGAAPTLREKIPTLEPGAAVPDFAMTMQDGSTAKLSDLRGQVVALTFIYTRCPDPEFCPLMDSRFSELARMVAAVPARSEKVRLLSISFDPKHDTPDVLSKHAQLRGAKSPLWQFAVADYDELRKVAEPLGLMYGPRENDIIHSLSTAVIGRDGKLVRLFPGSDWKVEEVFKAVNSSLAK